MAPQKWGDVAGRRQRRTKFGGISSNLDLPVIVRASFCSLFLLRHSPTKKVERSPARTVIQDTNGPSSDRFIEEGRALVRRLSFF